MRQIFITPAAGKRLIGMALTKHPEVLRALDSGTVVIVAGTTNGYVAEEILSNIGQGKDFSRKRFFRGIVLPPWLPRTEMGRISDDSKFPGDVIITDGIWQKGSTIFDVVDKLREGDVILKGANALNLLDRQAGIYIGHPKGGTILSALQAVLGRRVRLILPVGLEKRVQSDINELALKLNTPGVSGPCLLPTPGEVFTEIEAISMLTGAKAELVAGGGVCGAEGGVWLSVKGNVEEEQSAYNVLRSISSEKAFKF